MELTINGKNETLKVAESSIIITDLLKIKNVEMPDMVSVELNGNIVNRAEYISTHIKNGDAVEFLYFMGGGH